MAWNTFKNIFSSNMNNSKTKCKRKLCASPNESKNNGKRRRCSFYPSLDVSIDRTCAESRDDNENEASVLADLCTNTEFNITPPNLEPLQVKKQFPIGLWYGKSTSMSVKTRTSPIKKCGWEKLRTSFDLSNKTSNKIEKKILPLKECTNILLNESNQIQTNHKKIDDISIEEESSIPSPIKTQASIDYCSSNTDKTSFEITSLSLSQKDNVLDGEKELNLLIRDIQKIEKEKRVKIKKGGYVEKMQTLLRSNRSSYYFWKNELESGFTRPQFFGVILSIENYYTQSLITISLQDNKKLKVLLDLQSKIYKGQKLTVGVKVGIELGYSLNDQRKEKIILDKNKISKI